MNFVAETKQATAHLSIFNTPLMIPSPHGKMVLVFWLKVWMDLQMAKSPLMLFVSSHRSMYYSTPYPPTEDY